MPLSSKLKADYIELINQQLDSIQIDSVEDFELAQQALQNIIQPTTGYEIPEKYREKMFLIKDYLQSPEDYVEHEQNYNEYKQIIRDRITVKIDELQSLSATQKQSYIQNQQDHRARTTTNQQIMSQHRPPQPGSDAHVQTEAQWLAERQQQFNRERGAGNSTQRTPEGFQRRHFGIMNDITGVTGTTVDMDQVRALSEARARDEQQSQQPPISVEQTQRLVDSYQRYIAEYNQAHDSVQEDFFTGMGTNRNFNWFSVGQPQQLDMQAIRHLDTVRQEDLELARRNLGGTVRQEDLELQTGQRNLINQGQVFGLNESQLEAVRMYVINKLNVVRAMFNRTFSMLDFKDLTTEQISNVGTIALVVPSCITALSDERTTITQLADMDVDSLRQAVESDNYPNLGLRS